MGWLFAILLMLVAGAVSIVLVQVWQQKLILQTKLQACDLKVEKLGEEAAAKAAMQAERDKLAASYASLRAKAQAIAAADAEKAKAIAEQANTIRADAGAKAALQADRDELAAAFATLRERMQGVIDADAEKAKVIAETKRLSEQFNDRMASEQSQFADRKQRMEAELLTLEKELAPLRAEHSALSEESALTEMGFYKPRFGFATSVRYEQAIDQNYQKQKAMLKAKSAATCSKEWTIDGSVEKGRKHTEKYLSLLVRAFNGECDSAIAKVKATNYQTMENRINKAFESLNKLGEMQYCLIATQYRDLRLDELRLEYEHALKVQAEREEQRAIKEEMRQQAIAERELERAQQEAEREEQDVDALLLDVTPRVVVYRQQPRVQRLGAESGLEVVVGVTLRRRIAAVLGLGEQGVPVEFLEACSGITRGLHGRASGFRSERIEDHRPPILHEGAVDLLRALVDDTHLAGACAVVDQRIS